MRSFLCCEGIAGVDLVTKKRMRILYSLILLNMASVEVGML